jgi:hypothetical protein
MPSEQTEVISQKRKDTCASIIKALGESGGLLTLAAKKSGIGYSTVKRYVAEFPSVREAVQDAKEGMKDFTEGKLFENIKAGKEASIFFYLKTQAKDRGYIERQEFTGKDGGPIEHDIDPKGKLLSYVNSVAARAGASESNSKA